MGLGTTHDCWRGSYSSFNDWRAQLCEVAGYGDLRERYRIRAPWPEGDALVALLDHSDCEGDIKWDACGQLADRLEQLLPAMQSLDADSPLAFFGPSTEAFIAGLRKAYTARENVEFH